MFLYENSYVGVMRIVLFSFDLNLIRSKHFQKQTILNRDSTFSIKAKTVTILETYQNLKTLLKSTPGRC